MMGCLGLFTSIFYVLMLKEPYLEGEAKQLQKEYLKKLKGEPSSKSKNMTELEEVEEVESLDEDRSSRKSIAIGRWYDWLV